jgi:tetratricopeptide (TPR) repeat protein
VLARGGGNALQLALAYHVLASTELTLGRFVEAERHYRKSLETIEPCRDANPGFEAHCWYGLHQVLLNYQRAPEAERPYEAAVMGFERAKESCRTTAEIVAIHVMMAILHINHAYYELALEEIEAGLRQLPSNAKHLTERVEFLLTRMSCEFDGGFPDRGLETADSAESLLRSDRIREPDRSHACQLLGGLGVRLWHAGRNARAASLLLETAGLCEARGMVRQGLSSRLIATAVLRNSGRLQEAEAAFPAQAEPDIDSMSLFFDQRAELHLAMGRVPEAVADFERVLRLAEEVPEPDPIGVAKSRAWLAAGYYAAGRIEAAEAAARAAYEVLSPFGHQDAAEALVTLALIGWDRNEETARAQFDRAMRLTADAPFVERADKARFFERTARRLDTAGRSAEAQEARAAAAEHWRFLGLTEDKTSSTESAGSRIHAADLAMALPDRDI